MDICASLLLITQWLNNNLAWILVEYQNNESERKSTPKTEWSDA